MALAVIIKVSRSHLIRMHIASADDFKSACRRFATPFYALIYENVEGRANVTLSVYCAVVCITHTH